MTSRHYMILGPLVVGMILYAAAWAASLYQVTEHPHNLTYRLGTIAASFRDGYNAKPQQ